jgi:hypothetical protein
MSVSKASNKPFKQRNVEFDTIMEELLLQAVALEVAIDDKEDENTKLAKDKHDEHLQNITVIANLGRKVEASNVDISKYKAASNELDLEKVRVQNVIDMYRKCLASMDSERKSNSESFLRMKLMLESNIARLTLDNEDIEKSIADASDELGRIHDDEEDYKLEWYADEAIAKMSRYLESVIEGQELEEAAATKMFEDATREAADIVGDAELRAHAMVEMAKQGACRRSEH